MPEAGVRCSPKSQLMQAEEIYRIAKIFVQCGVTKIRLTGGEPLVRKDFRLILERLSTLPVALTLTTNAVLADRFIDSFKACGVQAINISLDTMKPDKFRQIARRDEFEKVHRNMQSLLAHGFEVKLNIVLIKSLNDDEIIDFIQLGKTLPLAVRFIEFMPFNGNRWDLKKVVSHRAIMRVVGGYFGEREIIREADAPNDTAKSYRVAGYSGTFAVISSVTNPFCDSCNRLRITADGKIKSCLFSIVETDLLSALRSGRPIEPIIQRAVQAKRKVRSGMNALRELQSADRHHRGNRSMIQIGG